VTEVYFIVEARDRQNQIVVRLSLKRGTLYIIFYYFTINYNIYFLDEIVLILDETNIFIPRKE
jgi:hypothetical protein